MECGESVNPPKIKHPGGSGGFVLILTKGRPMPTSSRPKGDPGLLAIFQDFFTFVKWSYCCGVITEQQWEDSVIEEVDCEDKEKQTDEDDQPDAGIHTMSAKFHFVDLAGSERAHKTGNAGERFKGGLISAKSWTNGRFLSQIFIFHFSLHIRLHSGYPLIQRCTS